MLTLGGCSVGDFTSTASASITVGTIDKVTSPTEYTVVLKKGLTFADIKFSFDRPQKIASQVGLGMLLHTLVRHAAQDATTVVYTVKATNGPGGEIRHIVFNFDTQPFGAKAGGPDDAKARSTLTSADITARVVLSLQHDTDHYGASSGAEYALVTSQLEQGGLFTVNLQSTDWGTNSKAGRRTRIRSTSSAGSLTTRTQTTPCRRSLLKATFSESTTTTPKSTR